MTTIDTAHALLAARIAELEAERDQWHGESVRQEQRHIKALDERDDARARIAELEDALGGARHIQCEMNARIVELEAELNRRLDEIKTAADVNETLQRAGDVATARVVELLTERDNLAIKLSLTPLALKRANNAEAERDRLTAALAEAQGYTRGLLGLCQLLGSRDDIPAAVKEVLRSNHRVVDAARSTS